jgi:hypothetical protein
MDELRISTETVCFIIARARAFHVKTAPTGMGDGTNPVDDNYQLVLEERPTDATEEELQRALEALNVEEMTHLLALMWLGRGDETIDEPGLTVPHPRMTERAFVLVPLLELEPELLHPVTGEPLAARLARGGLERVDRLHPPEAIARPGCTGGRTPDDE